MNDMRMSGFAGSVEPTPPSTRSDPDRLRRRAKLTVAIILGLALGGVVGLIAAIGTGLIGLC